MYVVYAIWVPLGYEPGDAAHIEFYGIYADRAAAKKAIRKQHRSAHKARSGKSRTPGKRKSKPVQPASAPE